jgi:Gly-Xaa carboxypeptidase
MMVLSLPSSTSSVNETIQHVIDVLTPLVNSLNFTLSAFDNAPKRSNSHVTLSILNGISLEPAPITPTDSKAFELVAGTCKTVFGEKTIVAPTGMYGTSRSSQPFYELY